MFDFSDIAVPDVTIEVYVDTTSDSVHVAIKPELLDQYEPELRKLKSQGFSVYKALDWFNISHPTIDKIQLAERLAAGFESQGLTVQRVARYKGDRKIETVQSFILA